MYSALRFMMSSAGGLAMATGLGLAMMALIRVEFKPQEAIKSAVWDLNPVKPDIEIVIDKTLPKLKTVEIPPAPPEIEKGVTDRPIEGPVFVEDPLPIDPPPPDIKIDREAILSGDVQEQPIVRIPPVMPPRAMKSGRCTLMFDLSPTGTPFNIEATYCSQSLFKSASIKSVQKWKYRPARINGKNIVRVGLTETIVFNLLDEQGRKIPE